MKVEEEDAALSSLLSWRVAEAVEVGRREKTERKKKEEEDDVMLSSLLL